MKNQLIELAKEKGFKPVLFEYIIDTLVSEETTLKDSNYLYYLWLCELQKWLINEYDIFVGYESFNNDYSKFKGQVVFCPLVEKLEHGRLLIHSKNYKQSSDDFEQALQAGLLEALKLI